MDRRERIRCVLRGCKSPVIGEIVHDLPIITTSLCLGKKKKRKKKVAFHLCLVRA